MNTFRLTAKSKGIVSLQMMSKGEVAGASFSIKHDSKLVFKGIKLVGEPDGTVVNTNEKTPGQIGVLFDGVKPYPASRKYVDIATLTFATGASKLEFADVPTRRSVASTDGRLLETKWVNGQVK